VVVEYCGYSGSSTTSSGCQSRTARAAAAPPRFSHLLPSVWSKRQWGVSRPRTAAKMRGRVAVTPASTNNLPSTRENSDVAT